MWLGDPRHDEARLGSLFDAPGGNADSSGLNPMGTGVAAPVLEQAFPTAPRALPAFQPCPPPSLNWPRAPGAPWQPTSSWDHPVHTARQHNSHSSSIGSFAMRPESLPVQLATSSVITGRSERRFMPTGPLPSNSVQPLTLSDPVPVACTFLFAVVNFFCSRNKNSRVTQRPHPDRVVNDGTPRMRPLSSVHGQAGARHLSLEIEGVSRITFGTSTISHATAG